MFEHVHDEAKDMTVNEAKLRDGKWPHDHCSTCGADQGTEPGQCAIDLGGEHAETDEWSADWAARAIKSESKVARYEVIVGLAHRFVCALGGARLRKPDLDALDALMKAINDLPIQDAGRCMDACTPASQSKPPRGA